MKSKNSVVFKRHRFWFKFYKVFVAPFAFFKGYKVKDKLKIKKGEQYIVLSNHQTDFDGPFVPLSFNAPLYALTTDSFLSKGLISKVLKHQLGLIGKHKGTVDIKANMEMLKCMREGGSLLIFPEGNRSYAEFQYPMTPGFAKFVRHFKKPIVLFNIHGGTGCYPRFSSKRRKGPFYGEIKEILQPEKFENWTDEELNDYIVKNLKVYDSDSGNLYKSPAKAEYLERMLFVCPKCGKVQTLSSKGDHITCSNCGLDVEYTEDLHLKSNDEEFKFTRLVDWYNFQLKYVKELKVGDEAIFKDDNVQLFISNPGKKRELIEEGSVVLYKDKILFNNRKILLSEIEIASPISGRKFNFSTKDENYLVIGSEIFNPLKYVILFNKLDTKMKLDKSDIYYTLEERN